MSWDLTYKTWSLVSITVGLSWFCSSHGNQEAAWERTGLLTGKPLPTTGFQVLIPVNYVSPKFLMFPYSTSSQETLNGKDGSGTLSSKHGCIWDQAKAEAFQIHTRKAIHDYKKCECSRIKVELLQLLTGSPSVAQNVAPHAFNTQLI